MTRWWLIYTYRSAWVGDAAEKNQFLNQVEVHQKQTHRVIMVDKTSWFYRLLALIMLYSISFSIMRIVAKAGKLTSAFSLLPATL